MIVLGKDDIVGAWVSREIGKLWVPGAGRALGWTDKEGALVAGVTFHNFDGVNVLLDVAATPKTRWLDRRGMWAIFQYCFEQLGVTRVTAMIPENNEKSIKLAKSAGFKYETCLEKAAPEGNDMLVFRMFEQECRWLTRTVRLKRVA